MDRSETAVQVAQQAFNCLGYLSTPERLERSFVATAWATGFPRPSHAEVDNNANPWATITIHYHYQEALVIRFWAMQAEVLFGYISKIMRMCEDELAIPVCESGILPRDVLRAMTQWSLARAGQRARAAGSPGIISPEDAAKIYNSLALRYEALVSASVDDVRPIPVEGFQLGLSRRHPWTEFLCYCADNLCDSIDLDEEVRPLATTIMQIAVSHTQTSLYQALQALS
jgi:hypothetical protein